MADDKVLIEIVTAANMAGVEEANAGMLKLANPILAVGAALGLGVEILKKSDEAYLSSAESVHKYMNVTGESAEVSSRQIEAFKGLGVSEEDAQAAMVKLSKAIETTPKKLAELNIEIAHTNAGTVDLNGTLLNVIDAWNGTEDAAKRNLIAITAFGKNGIQTMLPILQEGSAKLRQMEADAKLVFSDADLQKAHQYSLEQRLVAVSIDASVASIGRVFHPLDDLNHALAQQLYVISKITEGHKLASPWFGKVADDLRKEYDAGLAASVGLDNFKYSTQQAADTQAALAKEVDDAVNAIESEASASIALQRADLKVSESANLVYKAQVAYNQAVKDYGPNSEQAGLAADALTTAILDQKQSYFDARHAAAKLAEDQLGPNATATDKATAGHEALVKKLQEEAANLRPDSPLRVYLQGLIDEINAAGAAAANANIDITGGAIGGGARHFASGGHPRTGESAWVGEYGPELVTFGQGATVHPHSSGGGGDMSETNHLLRQLIAAVSPTGLVGVEAALYKATQGAGLNRNRGMAGA